MTYDETEHATVTLEQAIAECCRHGARTKSITPRDLVICDAETGDYWGVVLITAGRVSARDVLTVLGY